MNAQPAEAITESAEPTTAFEEVTADIRADILSLLETYPYLGYTMIQVGIGPAKPPKLWKPILEQLVEEGVILKQTVPVTSGRGRDITRTVYHRDTMPWPPVTVAQLTIAEDLAGIEAEPDADYNFPAE